MEGQDRDRIERFRQFRREIRGSESDLLVGIDIGKEKHHAFFGTATWKTHLRRLVFDNSREGFGWIKSKTDQKRFDISHLKSKRSLGYI
jgi:hypothetical protein